MVCLLMEASQSFKIELNSWVCLMVRWRNKKYEKTDRDNSVGFVCQCHRIHRADVDLHIHGTTYWLTFLSYFIHHQMNRIFFFRFGLFLRIFINCIQFIHDAAICVWHRLKRAKLAEALFPKWIQNAISRNTMKFALFSNIAQNIRSSTSWVSCMFVCIIWPKLWSPLMWLRL